MEQKSKIHNFEKVRNLIKELEHDSFTNHDVVKKTGLNYEQVKRILSGLVEIDEIKYSEINKIYVRL